MELQIIQQKIHEIRGVRVLLDVDLAELYGVETKVLNQAVKRNHERFPDDFMFQLTTEEWFSIRDGRGSQFVTPSKKFRSKIYLPYCFTEQGVAMLSGVLRSPKAVYTNIAIMRAFVALRNYARTYAELSQKIAELEAKYDLEIADIHEALTQLAPQDEEPNAWQNRPRIGFKNG